MEIYLVRHGETDWNAQGKLQGREDLPLNGNGKRQAMACGVALSEAGFTAIYSSPLKRALETAGELALYHPCGVTPDPALTERDYGKLSGLTRDQRVAWEARGLPSGKEHWQALAGRAMAAVDRRASEHGENSRIAMVSHGAWINAVLAVLSRHEIGTGKTQLKNTCISVIRREGKGAEIVCYNLSPEEYSQWAVGR